MTDVNSVTYFKMKSSTMKSSTILYFGADFIRIVFGAIFQAAWGVVTLVALNWISMYSLGYIIIPNINLWMGLIFYIFIPCYIIVFFMSDIREFKKQICEEKEKR